jgi:hypothetical protein
MPGHSTGLAAGNSFPGPPPGSSAENCGGTFVTVTETGKIKDLMVASKKLRLSRT